MKKHKTLAAGVIFAAMVIVLILKKSLILKMYALSLWPDMTFYTSLGLQPGVALPVIASVITQFCHFFPIGILLILLSLYALAAVMKKLVGDNIWAYIPSVLAFLFIAGFDYSTYTMRAQGLLFSQTIGLTLAALLIYGWKCVKCARGRIVYIALTTIIGYPLIGAYSILATLGIAVAALCEKGDKAVCVLLSLICGLLVPMIYASLVFSHIDTHYTYVAGLPYMDFVDNGTRFVPLVLAMLTVAILPALKGMLAGTGEKPAVSLTVAALVIAGFVFCPFWDRNFHLELGMEQAIEKNDWKKVLKLAEKSEKPTRVIVMYRNIALMNTGKLCDRMFTYSHESISINTPAQISQTEVCAPTAFFYNGHINYSTRWAWEMSMMFQRTIERYKYQAKVALFTGQENPALVETYLGIIEKNLFEKKWVKKYRNYLYDHEALMKDPEYQMFLQLNEFPEIKFVSSAVVENTLLDHFTNQENPQGIMLDLALAASMTSKNIDAFWYYYYKFRDRGVRIPTHIAEAAILFAYIEKDQALISAVAQDLGGPNAPVVQKFTRFSGEMSKIRDVEAARPEFKEKYGDTFWYYCYFIQSLETN